MKIGDIVRVTDGSYSLSLQVGELLSVGGTELRDRLFRVVSLNEFYPTNSPLCDTQNDTLLVDESNSNFVLFTQERFCYPGTLVVKVPHGTKEVHLVASGPISVTLGSCKCPSI